MSATSFVMPNDLSDLCRVCLQLPEESQYLDLTTIYDEEDNLTYGECFTICTHIDLNAGDGVPHHLCKSCGLELQMSYDFHKKIEESKRVIEQCQKQIYEHKANVVGAVASIEQPNNVNSDAIDEMDIVQLINNKYGISDDEELAETSQEMEDMCGMQHENEQHFEAQPDEDEETDEIDIINSICQIEANTQQEVPPDKDCNTSLKPLNAHDVEGDGEEMEDYQNLEALEDEETVTETIQINVTKYNIIECGENDEYAEEENEGEEEEDYTQEPNEDDMEEQLRWQNNVVAVASKEHLPINIEDEEGTEEEEAEEEGDETRYETSVFKNNANQIILEESLQDENVEQEEVNENDSEASKKTSSANKNSNNNTSRKRHVGSYSCDYCQRVYPNYSRMKTHRRCHETDRPKFSCSHCGRMYATKQARDCHIQTAHEKSGYNCSICSKVFAIRKSLEIHVRYHTGDFPYACKLCDRKFAQACHLNTHVNVKHNKIRFSCDYPGCGKFFTSSTSLRNHEYTHGIMPFECEYCQQGFPAKAKLRIHIQRKHGMDLSKDQLENMRKFHVMRSKVNLVQFVDT